ncbi:MAG: SDR family oxidoreductase [Chitinivibrionales bacterium]|nr:SDR family oxidoreductase [Chitinivibrionales bacterium]
MHFSEFEGKIVLITGAAGGFGSALCSAFAENGAVVHGTDVRKADIKHFHTGDIGDAAFLKRMVDSIVQESGTIDILINNAGICPRVPFDRITLDEWQKVLHVNLTSIFVLSQLVLPRFIENKQGAIVNLASLAGQVGGIAVGAHYSASKAAIQSLTKTLARIGGPHGVRVNAAAPGIIDTAITREAAPGQIVEFERTIPLQRLGRAQEVVAPILFLASDAASYITGATLDINGGLRMN